jgi:hypothetical protein
MEFDCTPCVVVEVISGQYVREIQHQNKVDWVMMVARGIVVVVRSPSNTNS